MCVISSQDTFTLTEIDLSGNYVTTNTVFNLEPP